MIRVLLVDDHGVVRDALASLINAQADCDVVGATGLARDGVKLCAELNPDVVLLDFGLPDLDGLEAARQILAVNARARILVLTMCENADVAKRMLAIGVRGYVVKSAPSAELLMALRKVARGRRHVTPHVMEAMLDGLGALSDQPPEAALTERELQVLQHIATGLSPPEIAQLLSISPSTVETYRGRLKAKLDLHSTADIIRFALRRGLVKL